MNLIISELEAEFPLKIVEKKAKRGKKRHWREAVEASEEFDSQTGLSKHIKLETEEDSKAMDIDAVLNSGVTKVGTMQPVEDFEAILKSNAPDSDAFMQGIDWKGSTSNHFSVHTNVGGGSGPGGVFV